MQNVLLDLCTDVCVAAAWEVRTNLPFQNWYLWLFVAQFPSVRPANFQILAQVDTINVPTQEIHCTYYSLDQKRCCQAAFLDKVRFLVATQGHLCASLAAMALHATAQQDEGCCEWSVATTRAIMFSEEVDIEVARSESIFRRFVSLLSNTGTTACANCMQMLWFPTVRSGQSCSFCLPMHGAKPSEAEVDHEISRLFFQRQTHFAETRWCAHYPTPRI